MPFSGGHRGLEVAPQALNLSELMESLTPFALGGTSFVTRGQETSLIKLPSGKVLELPGF